MVYCGSNILGNVVIQYDLDWREIPTPLEAFALASFNNQLVLAGGGDSDSIEDTTIRHFRYTSRKKHFFEMKGDVGMAGVQIMKKEVNKTTTTTNTSYSIPTSFVGTAYPWVHVKDVGMCL